MNIVTLKGETKIKRDESTQRNKKRNEHTTSKKIKQKAFEKLSESFQTAIADENSVEKNEVHQTTIKKLPRKHNEQNKISIRNNP